MLRCVTLTIASYNIHRGRGLDGRVEVGRTAAVLEEIGADVVALQEVLRPQAEELADRLRMGFAMGITRICGGQPYGNAILTRLPVRGHDVFDLTRRRREPRGGVRLDTTFGDSPLHLFNVHFGLAIRERAQQVRMLVREHLGRADLSGLRVVAGDLNEWFPGAVGRHLKRELMGRRIGRTHPAPLPLFRLDRIYWDHGLYAERVHVHRSRLARVASDHLPVVARLRTVVAARSETRAG
jgi:endonuclease/exonuclease/phosphatase family metal-dependent hydrolase